MFAIYTTSQLIEWQMPSRIKTVYYLWALGPEVAWGT